MCKVSTLDARQRLLNAELLGLEAEDKTLEELVSSYKLFTDYVHMRAVLPTDAEDYSTLENEWLDIVHARLDADL